MIFPDAMLGMLGGGQLGRMFTLAAHRMGYRVTVLDPDPLSPAGAIADVHLKASYDDVEALQQLADSCVAVTTEFENVPADSLRWLAKHCEVRPDGEAVAIAQDRVREKAFFTKTCGLAVAPYAVISSQDDAEKAEASLFPGILKRARFGYDGKGQTPVNSAAEAKAAFLAMGSEQCVLEQRVELACEVSAVVVRGADGTGGSFPVAENRHRKGVLDVSIVPARITPVQALRTQQAALRIAQQLKYCGVMAVEFFITKQGGLLVNEMAPRPHNSGHYTIDACATSQFEQQVRALCGLPLGDARLLKPVVMVNLLGDAWENGEPAWGSLFAVPGAKLHLYGKHEARAGRKMGHYTVLADRREAAIKQALELRSVFYPDWKD